MKYNYINIESIIMYYILICYMLLYNILIYCINTSHKEITEPMRGSSLYISNHPDYRHMTRY